MPLGANVRHFVGLLIAVVGGLFGFIMAIVFAMMAGQKQEPAAYACTGLSVALGLFVSWRGVRMRNRAAKESTIFKEEVTENTWTTVTGKGKAPYRREPKPEDDDW